MIHGDALLTILLMASATYAMRVLGYFAVSKVTLGVRAKAVLDAAPACVLLAVISPAFVVPRPADLTALGLTAIAATRLPMIATVTIAVAATAVLRALLG